MSERKAIPKSRRFEVFKRDSFKCQYCGAGAPEVVLEVDHIHPVSKGGKNDILNLITSCSSCNSGKSDKLLSDDSAISKQKQQLDELNERRQQLEMLLQWKGALADRSFEIDKVVDYFNKLCNTDISLTDSGVMKLRSLIKKHGIEDVISAVEEAADKYHHLETEERWQKISVVIKYLGADENTKQKAYVLGIIKNKFGAYRLTEAAEWIDEALRYDIDMDHLIQSTKSDRSWSVWKSSMSDFIEKEKCDF